MTELDERTKEEFAKLMHVIVREEFSDELTPFSVAGERLISQTFARAEEVSTERDYPAEFHFLHEAQATIQFISLILGSYRTVQQIVEANRKKQGPTDLRTKWKHELTLAGLSAEKADKIAKTFNSELDSVIEKRR